MEHSIKTWRQLFFKILQKTKLLMLSYFNKNVFSKFVGVYSSESSVHCCFFCSIFYLICYSNSVFLFELWVLKSIVLVMHTSKLCCVMLSLTIFILCIISRLRLVSNSIFHILWLKWKQYLSLPLVICSNYI